MLCSRLSPAAVASSRPTLPGEQLAGVEADGGGARSRIREQLATRQAAEGQRRSAAQSPCFLCVVPPSCLRDDNVSER